MHERAGDVILPRNKLKLKNSPKSNVGLSSLAKVKSPPKELGRVSFLIEKKELGKANDSSKQSALSSISTPNGQMTRRFTVAEKLRIIDKHKELKNISATTRWVRDTFTRRTFTRRALSKCYQRRMCNAMRVEQRKFEKRFVQRAVRFGEWKGS